MLGLRNLGLFATSLGNRDFNGGLAQATGLLKAWTGKVTAANVQAPLPNVVPYVIQQMGSRKVAFIGVFGQADQAATDQTIVAGLNVTASDVQSLLDARDAAEAAGANYFVALLSGRVNLPVNADAVVAPFAAKFDFIAFGLALNTEFQRSVNGTLVLSSLESGTGYARVLIPSRTLTFVRMPANTPQDPQGALDLTVWTQLSTCKGSSKTVTVTHRMLGRAVSRSTNGLRYCRIAENPLNTLQLEGMRRIANTQIAVMNTGATRDDLPSSFVPDAGLGLQRNSATGPLDLVSGDADSISPFGNGIVRQNATSAELCKIAVWALCSDAAPQISKQIMGQFVGLKFKGIMYSNLSCAVTDFRLTTGELIDCSLTTDSHPVALTSFLLTGGDNFPIIAGPSFPLNQTDRDVHLAQLKLLGVQAGASPVPIDTFLPFDMIITRRERICARSYTMEVQVAWNASISNTSFSALPFSNSSAACVEMEITGLSPRQFSQRGSSFTSVSTVLATPNDFSVIVRRDGLIAGQIAGYALNITVYSSDPALAGSFFPVRVCLPEASDIKPFYSAFNTTAIAVSRDGGPFLLFTGKVDFVNNDTGFWATYCGTIDVQVNQPTVVIAARSTSSSSFAVVEQVFLFLFGIVYLAFTIYAGVLLVHHILLTRAQSDEWSDFLNPAMVVRVELMLVGICRFLYFVLLPWDTFARNPLGGYFLFEFPFILDFSIYSTFIQLFVTVFHWRKLRTIEKRYLWVPLLIVNLLLFAFFFIALIVYGVSASANVQQAVVLAYRITLASVAFLVVVCFAVYGTVLFRRVRAAVKAGNAPSWLAQMQRLTIVTALATCGILAIFIVIIYSAIQVVPDPVLSSTPWLICFLFFAELLPLLAILHDLHRTALVNQSTFLSAVSSKGENSSSSPAQSGGSGNNKRRATLSFKVASSAKENASTSRQNKSRIDSDNVPSAVISGEVADVDKAFADAEVEVEEHFKRNSVVL